MISPRFPRFPKLPVLQFLFPHEPLPYGSTMDTYAAIELDRYLMRREEWYWPDGGVIEGVPRCQWVDGGVSVVGYRCENCKRFFIAAELLDFEHGCRKEDFRP